MMSKLPRILRLFSASRSPWMCRRSPPRSRSSPRPPHLCWRWVIAIMTVPINVIFHGDTSWYFLMTFHGILWWYFKMTVDDIWNFMPMATIDLAPLPHLPRCQNPRCSKPRQCTSPGNLSIKYFIPLAQNLLSLEKNVLVPIWYHDNQVVSNQSHATLSDWVLWGFSFVIWHMTIM